VLVYFGYTFCPDICPTSLAATAEGLKQLSPEELARVAMIFVSVDPKRDTPERLKEYVEFFHPSIVGVTGSAEVVAEVAKRYGVIYAEQKVETAGGGYVVDHSADTFIVAQDGRWSARLPMPRRPTRSSSPSVNI
jgi:protein SCO1/2